MSRTMTFIPGSSDVALTVPPPKPAAHYLPDWYKRAKTFAPDNEPIIRDGHVANFDIKACAPFGDAFRFGWIQETWADLWIEPDGDSVSVQFSRSDPRMITYRGPVRVPVDDSFHQHEFVFHQAWVPKAPPGYSVMVCHPLNHVDLPFFVPSGIIDSDVFHHTYMGNTPLWIKRGFTGLIPAGTPMYQLVPLKRESWGSSIQAWDEQQYKRNQNLMWTRFHGTYRKLFHQRKEFK